MRFTLMPLPILLLTILMAGSACTTTPLRHNEVASWLKTISDEKKPTIDVTGSWSDADRGAYHFFGWGQGHLIQKDAKVNGALGGYVLRGIVSGDTLYLVFMSGGRVDYTARLIFFEKDTLRGTYHDAADKNQEKGYPMGLQRLKQSVQEGREI